MDSGMIDLEAAARPIDDSDPMQQEASDSPEGEAQHDDDSNNNSDDDDDHDDIESLREKLKDIVSYLTWVIFTCKRRRYRGIV